MLHGHVSQPHERREVPSGLQLMPLPKNMAHYALHDHKHDDDLMAKTGESSIKARRGDPSGTMKNSSIDSLPHNGYIDA